MPFGLVGDNPGAEGSTIASMSVFDRVGSSTGTVRGFDSISTDCLVVVPWE